MKTIEQTRRELFEAQMVSSLIAEGYNLDGASCVIMRRGDGSYSSVRVSGAWQGFNAALDAVVIELPQEDDHGRITRTRAVRAIESTNLGLKIR